MPTNINVSLHDFSDNEVLSIQASNLYNASYQYGYQTKELIQQKLNALFWGISNEEKRRRLMWALMKYKKLSDMAQSGLCIVNGINYLERYLEAFHGFCKGAEISAGEGALLQLEIEFGCQTIVTKDKKLGHIRFVHTEEDGNYHIPKLSTYPYRWIDMTLPDKHVSFFIYPGLCGWGSAYGINHTHDFIQLVDDLFMKDEFFHGLVWANAMAFMTLDCGVISDIKQLFEKIRVYPDTNYAGGYALNLIEAWPVPRMAQVEFADNEFAWIEVNETSECYWYSHTNFAINESIRSNSEISIPQLGASWNVDAAMHYCEMQRKHLRLQTYAQQLSWFSDDLALTLDKGLRLLAQPEADLLEFNKNKEINYRLSCFPSIWTASHTVGFVASETVEVYVGKMTPSPLPDRPYAYDYSPGYPYVISNLRREAEKLYQTFIESNF